jgi:DNA polymerase-3 subunit gamma/tau
MRVLSRMWQMLLKGITEVQGATRPAAAAEMVLVRIAYVADLPTPDEAIRMLERNGGSSPVVGGNAVPRSAPASTMLASGMSTSGISASGMSSMPSSPARATSALRAGSEASARPQTTAPILEAQSEPAALKIASFPQLVALAGEKRDLMTRTALEADVRLVRIEDGRLELAMERSASRTLINDLSRKLEQWTGRRWTVIVSNEPGQPTLRAQSQLQQSERERAAEADPRVREVLARFPGTKVVEVRKLAPEPPESDVSGEEASETIDDDD